MHSRGSMTKKRLINQHFLALVLFISCVFCRCCLLLILLQFLSRIALTCLIVCPAGAYYRQALYHQFKTSYFNFCVNLCHHICVARLPQPKTTINLRERFECLHTGNGGCHFRNAAIITMYLCVNKLLKRKTRIVTSRGAVPLCRCMCARREVGRRVNADLSLELYMSHGIVYLA